MTKGSNFWVIGGEFGSMNFHKLVEGSAQVRGPFKTRKEAEECWKEVSEESRHKAGVRFSILEKPSRISARPAANNIFRKRQGQAAPSGKPGGAVCNFFIHYLTAEGWGRGDPL